MVKSDNMIHIVQDAIHADFLKDNDLLKLLRKTYDLLISFNCKTNFLEFATEQLKEMERAGIIQ